MEWSCEHSPARRQGPSMSTANYPAHTAHRAWIALQGATGQANRLSSYRSPTKAMREDMAMWDRRAYEAKKELTEQLPAARDAMAKMRNSIVLLLAAIDAEHEDTTGTRYHVPAENARE